MATLTWNDIFTTGSLIHYSRHQWRAATDLTPEDLGITATVVETEEGEGEKSKKRVDNIITHRLKLARRDAFKEINQIMTAFITEIESRSLDFPVLESVRYVPDTQVAVLRTNLEQIGNQFKAAVEKFVRNFDSTRRDGLADAEVDLRKNCRTEESFIKTMEKIRREYPDAQAVQTKFGQEYDFFTIQVPVSAEAAKAAKEAAPQVRGVVESMIQQLRGELTDKVALLITQIDKSVKTNKTLNLKSINSALEVLDKVDSLNFLGDSQLTEQAAFLRTMLKNTKDAKESKQETNLGDLLAGLNKTQAIIAADIAGAVEAAQNKLTNLGGRRMNI